MYRREGTDEGRHKAAGCLDRVQAKSGRALSMFLVEKSRDVILNRCSHSPVILNSIQVPSEIGCSIRFDRGMCLIRGTVDCRGLVGAGSFGFDDGSRIGIYTFPSS